MQIKKSMLVLLFLPTLSVADGDTFTNNFVTPSSFARSDTNFSWNGYQGDMTGGDYSSQPAPEAPLLDDGQIAGIAVGGAAALASGVAGGLVARNAFKKRSQAQAQQQAQQGGQSAVSGPLSVAIPPDSKHLYAPYDPSYRISSRTSIQGPGGYGLMPPPGYSGGDMTLPLPAGFGRLKALQEQMRAKMADITEKDDEVTVLKKLGMTKDEVRMVMMNESFNPRVEGDFSRLERLFVDEELGRRWVDARQKAQRQSVSSIHLAIPSDAGLEAFKRSKRSISATSLRSSSSTSIPSSLSKGERTFASRGKAPVTAVVKESPRSASPRTRGAAKKRSAERAKLSFSRSKGSVHG